MTKYSVDKFLSLLSQSYLSPLTRTRSLSSSSALSSAQLASCYVRLLSWPPLSQLPRIANSSQQAFSNANTPSLSSYLPPSLSPFISLHPSLLSHFSNPSQPMRTHSLHALTLIDTCCSHIFSTCVERTCLPPNVTHWEWRARKTVSKLVSAVSSTIHLTCSLQPNRPAH